MVRFVAVVVCLVTLVAAAGPAEAQYFGRNKVHYDHLDFRVLQTDHFDIYYYPEEEEATRHAARMAERWYTRFSQVLHHSFSRRQHAGAVREPSALRTDQRHAGVAGRRNRRSDRADEVAHRDAVCRRAWARPTTCWATRSRTRSRSTSRRPPGRTRSSCPGGSSKGWPSTSRSAPAIAHTAMWLRDAAANNRLPTFEQLDDPQYFPYRFGHALWSFLAGSLRRRHSRRRSCDRRRAARCARIRRGDRAGRRPAARRRGTRRFRTRRAADVSDERHSAAHRIAAFDRDGARLHLAPGAEP